MRLMQDAAAVACRQYLWTKYEVQLHRTSYIVTESCPLVPYRTTINCFRTST